MCLGSVAFCGLPAFPSARRAIAFPGPASDSTRRRPRCCNRDQSPNERGRRARPTEAPARAMVGGRRVRTVDIHAHVIVPEAMVMAGRKIVPANGNVITGKRAEERFAAPIGQLCKSC